MAPQPGKKVKQGIETLLTTAKQVQGQDQITNVLSPVAQNVQQATTKATEQARKAQTKLADKTATTGLESLVKVDQSAYTPPKPQATGYTSDPKRQSIARTVAQNLSTPGIESLIAADNAYTRALSSSQGRDAETLAGAKQNIGITANALQAGREGKLAGIEKALNESTGRITDEKGNIIGSNKTLGQVAPIGNLEARALQRNEALAAQDPRSNLESLATLLGPGFDTRFAGLASQAYQGDVARERELAGLAAEKQAVAEKGRALALEDYLQTAVKGKQNVADARTKLGKNIDTFTAKAEEDLAKAEKAFQEGRDNDAKIARQAILNKADSTYRTLDNDWRNAAAAGDIPKMEKLLADARKLDAVMKRAGNSYGAGHIINMLEKSLAQSRGLRTSSSPQAAEPQMVDPLFSTV